MVFIDSGGDEMKDRSRRKLLGLFGSTTLTSLIIAPSGLFGSNGRVKLLKGLPGPQGGTNDIGKVKEVAIENVPCPSWPLQSLGAVTVEGDPEASGKTVFETDDRAISGGVWKCSVGTFDLTFTWDEMAMLLEGELIIEESPNQRIHVRPGDFFFVPRGTKTRWTVLKPLKKVFFSRESSTA
jgi:uncharacterized protein